MNLLDFVWRTCVLQREAMVRIGVSAQTTAGNPKGLWRKDVLLIVKLDRGRAAMRDKKHYIYNRASGCAYTFHSPVATSTCTSARPGSTFATRRGTHVTRKPCYRESSERTWVR